jgi:hypothetical protein
MEPFVGAIAAVLMSVSQPSLPEERANHLATIFVEEAAANGEVDAFGLMAVASVESGRTFRSDLESSAGACGMMQVIPRFQRERHSCEAYKTDDRLSVRIAAQALVNWRNYEQRHCRGGHDYPAHYNSGNRVIPRSLRYARTVRGLQEQFERQHQGFVVQ